MKNEACRNAIRDFAERGGRIVAECGGMMYLCKSIVTDNGEYPMCGVFPYTITARTCDRKLSLGYRRFVLNGNEYRGHEFHYTQFLGATPPSVAQVYDAYDNPVPTHVFHYKNVLASYTHLYHLPHLSTLNSQPYSPHASPSSHHVSRYRQRRRQKRHCHCSLPNLLARRLSSRSFQGAEYGAELIRHP